jgi:hypothetical protein
MPYPSFDEAETQVKAKKYPSFDDAAKVAQSKPASAPGGYDPRTAPKFKNPATFKEINQLFVKHGEDVNETYAEARKKHPGWQPSAILDAIHKAPRMDDALSDVFNKEKQQFTSIPGKVKTGAKLVAEGSQDIEHAGGEAAGYVYDVARLGRKGAKASEIIPTLEGRGGHENEVVRKNIVGGGETLAGFAGFAIDPAVGFAQNLPGIAHIAGHPVETMQQAWHDISHPADAYHQGRAESDVIMAGATLLGGYHGLRAIAGKLRAAGAIKAAGEAEVAADKVEAVEQPAKVKAAKAKVDAIAQGEPAVTPVAVEPKSVTPGVNETPASNAPAPGGAKPDVVTAKPESPKPTSKPGRFDVAHDDLAKAHDVLSKFLKSNKGAVGPGGGDFDPGEVAKAVHTIVKDAMGKGIKTIDGARQAIVDNFGEWYDALEPHLQSAWAALNPKEKTGGGSESGKVINPAEALRPDLEVTIENTNALTAALRSAEHDIRKTFSPKTASADATETDAMLARRIGEHDRLTAAFDATYGKAKGQLDKAIGAGQKDEIWKAVYEYESHQPISNEAMQPYIDMLRHISENQEGLVKQVKGDEYDGFLDDYIGHLYKEPDTIRRVMAEIKGRRLKINAGFLKKRTLPTFQDAHLLGQQLVDQGIVEKNPFEPVSDNPLEVAKMRYNQVSRWNMLEQFKSDLLNAGHLKAVMLHQHPQEGWGRINDDSTKIFQVRGTTKVTGEAGAPEMVLRGQYYAPQPVADLINGWLSQGLGGKPWYNAARGLSGGMTSMELGLSGYHWTMTTLQLPVMEERLGLMKLFNQGDVKGALKQEAKAALPLTQLPEYYKLGGEVRQAYLHPGEGSERAQAGASAVAKGGGATSLNQQAGFRQFEDMVSLARRGAYGHALAKAPAGLLRMLSYPLFDEHVPRVKLAAYTKLVEQLDSQFPNATESEQLQLYRMAWEHTDNFFGQVNYNTVLLPRMVQDLAKLGMRSFGWTGGSARAAVGAIRDTTIQAGALGKGIIKGDIKGAWGDVPITSRMLTPNQAGIASTAIRFAAFGAMTQMALTKFNTGQVIYPAGKDWFHPRTGRKTPNGEDERIDLPGYHLEPEKYQGRLLKDIVKAKAAPLWGQIWDDAENNDWQGRAIANPASPMSTKMAQWTWHIIQGYTPISASTEAQAHGPAEKAGAFFGIRATGTRGRATEDESILHAAEALQMKGEVLPDQAKRKDARSELTYKIITGKSTPKDIDDALAKKIIDPTGQRPDESKRAFVSSAVRTHEERTADLFDKIGSLDSTAQEAAFKAADLKRQAIYMPYRVAHPMTLNDLKKNHQFYNGDEYTALYDVLSDPDHAGYSPAVKLARIRTALNTMRKQRHSAEVQRILGN